MKNRFFKAVVNREYLPRIYGLTANDPVLAHDVFVDVTVEQMQAETGKRADTICQLMQDVIDGKLHWSEYINHPFHRGDVVLSPIKNPCKPYRKELL